METPVTGWNDWFARWPAEMPHRGVLVTAMNEQIPFTAFLAGEAFLILERQTPDSLGARTVVLPYAQIVTLKIVDVVKPRAFQSLGFAVPAAKK